MPNWCYGNVEVTGSEKGVEEFCKHFVFEYDKENRPKQKPFFARSFIHSTWREFKKENAVGKMKSVAFPVDFAWSCTSCMIDGYPQDDKDRFITLKSACKKHKVSVTIDTEECGLEFEEEIKCDSQGNLGEDCYSMASYECKKCKQEQSFPSREDHEDRECCGCDNYGEFKLLKARTLQ